MLNGPTVFVLGAGSGVDFGMPTGAELKADIIRRLSPTGEDSYGKSVMEDQPLRTALGKLFENGVVPYESVSEIVRSLPRFDSIDDFLFSRDDNPNITTIGKLAIARSIKAAEWESLSSSISLGGTPSNFLSAYESTWVDKLMQIVGKGVKRSEISSVFNDLTVISFNYDRTIEASLLFGLRQMFDVSEEDAQPALENLSIFKPYGSIGVALSGSPSLGLELAQKGDLVAIADGIRTYTEGLEDDETLTSMKERIARANNVVFLGFAFHTQNMNLLGQSERQRNHGQQILATAFDETTASQDTFRSRILQSLGTQRVNFGHDKNNSAAFLSENRLLIES